MAVRLGACLALPPLRWNVSSFGVGVVVGVLIVQSTANGDPPAASPLSRTPSPRLTMASPASVGSVATTFPTEAAAAPPSPALRPGGTSARATADYRGALTIESRPEGATVFLNNQPVGRTPIELSSLSAGSRAVRLELTGYATWSRGVRVVAGQSTRVSAQLEPTPLSMGLK